LNYRNVRHFLSLFLCVVFVLVCSSPGFGWGEDGHKIINRNAAEKVPASMPEFFKRNIERIVYDGPEPDRWREKLEFSLKNSQEPDHYIDLERIADVPELPEGRYDFIKLLYAKRARATENADDFLPEHVGMQPYIALEVYGRLKVAFRQYRQLKAAGKPTADAEQNAVFYAGWLGHYVADAANPLHTTIHHDGWKGPNPNGYTTAKIHWPIESDFLARNLNFMETSVSLLKSPVLLNSPFRDYMSYLKSSFALVEPLYQLEKRGGFNEGGTEEGRTFIRGRLAEGSQMLLNMWYTAWVESEKPVPVYKADVPAVPAPASAPK
jgi:hypothetical protein